VAMALMSDPVGCGQTEPPALADVLGGEERLEDAGAAIRARRHETIYPRLISYGVSGAHVAQTHPVCQPGVSKLRETYPCRRRFMSELWTCRPPLYSMKPSFRNLFMKPLTRERVLPIISASVS
jgi:hypothetical protein